MEYITVEGTTGGSMLAAAAVNALLMIQQGLYV
ncbi:MAG: precorrin-8X methylmutase [Thiolinea sp.]